MAIKHAFTNPIADDPLFTGTKPSHWNANHIDNKNVVVKLIGYLATTTDDVIVCNSGVAISVTLPVASGSGHVYYIKNIGAGVVTVDGDGGDLIDGVITQPLAQWDAITIVDYAANNWAIL